MTVLTRLAETHPDVTQRAYYDLNPVGTRHYTSQLFIRHRDPLTLRPILDADQRQYAFINPKTIGRICINILALKNEGF
jgi:hypothetical protein